MIRQISTLGAIIILAFLLVSCGNSDGKSEGKAEEQTGDYRLTMRVADVTASADDSLIAVPVYISHPQDTLAGIEFHLRADQNPSVYFAMDELREDGIVLAADTAGTMLSGWEWLGVTSLDSSVYDLRLVSLADWPDQNVTPPAVPSGERLLATLYFRVDKKHPIAEDTRINITVNPEKTSFADPRGNTVGMLTAVKKVCSQYVGDSCVAWKQMKVGGRDTSLVHFANGSITIPGPGK